MLVKNTLYKNNQLKTDFYANEFPVQKNNENFKTSLTFPGIEMFFLPSAKHL